MAESKTKRWVPGKLDFNDIRFDLPEIPAHIFEGKFHSTSMGCKVPESTCPLCEDGVPVKHKPIISTDTSLHQLELKIAALYAARQEGLVSGQAILEAAGLMIESPEGRRLAPLPDPALSTHDAAHYNLPAVGERVIGVDFGDDERPVLVAGIIKRLNEPNKNGDVFMLEDVKVMDFPPAKIKGTVTGRITNKEHLNRNPRKGMNKTAKRIKAMTETYIKTYQGDPHHIPQTPPRTRIFEMNSLDDIEPGPMLIPRVDETTPSWVLRKVLEEIKERQEWLATSENAPKLIEAKELSREQYTLYREQQRVEALLYPYQKEAEMEVLQPGGDLPPVHCPRCDAPMILREAGRGLMVGHEFYGCSNYPKCDATRTLNEVKEEYPKQWKVTAEIVKGEPKQFQLAIFYGGHQMRTPLMGKRFTKNYVNGGEVFQDFIEPASRAAGSTLAAMVRATLEALNVKNAGVITKRMVRDIGAIDPIQTVDDIMLDKVLKETKLVQDFLGIKPERKLFRINVERCSYKKDGAEVLQLRAKDRKGQTIKTSEMPWGHMDDPYAMEQLITEFCVATSEELGLGSGIWQGAEDVLDCLIKSTRDTISSGHSRIRHALKLVNQVAMQINFRPAVKKPKLVKYKEDVVKSAAQAFNRVSFMPRKLKHGPLSAIVLSEAHPCSERENRELELTAYGPLGNDYFQVSWEPSCSTKHLKEQVVRFSQKVGEKFKVAPGRVLELVKIEVENQKPPHVLTAGERQQLLDVFEDIIVLNTKKERPLSEISPHAWSQGTEKFIEEQKRLAPQKEKERRERLHKAQEDARKLEKRTKIYEAGYCKKCDKAGCMCPRPINPNDPEHHPLHNCKGGKHVRVRPIPLQQQNDLGLGRDDWVYCLDCFAIIDSNGIPNGLKLSTLDAPQDS